VAQTSVCAPEAEDYDSPVIKWQSAFAPAYCLPPLAGRQGYRQKLLVPAILSVKNTANHLEAPINILFSRPFYCGTIVE